MAPKKHRAAAFTLIELLLVVIIIALLISILLPALGKARKSARTMRCAANLSQYGRAMINYSTDAAGSISTFYASRTTFQSQYPDLNTTPNNDPTQWHANQVVDIIRRNFYAQMPVFYERMFNRNYSYLVLADGGYMGNGTFPVEPVGCTEDRNTLIWQRNATSMVANATAANQVIANAPMPGNTEAYPDFARFLPFWSSYQMVPNAWSPEKKQKPSDFLIYQVNSTSPGDYDLYYYSPGNTYVEKRRMDLVSFPSQKVVMFDLFDRHFAPKGAFHAMKRAKQPLLFFDGSVTYRATKDADQGWNPTNPSFPGPTTYTYAPSVKAGDPPTINGAPTEPVVGYYRWTRNGLRGVDFAGQMNP
jgi:type II secretory pathway pseudopilin PulG